MYYLRDETNGTYVASLVYALINRNENGWTKSAMNAKRFSSLDINTLRFTKYATENRYSFVLESSVAKEDTPKIALIDVGETLYHIKNCATDQYACSSYTDFVENNYTGEWVKDINFANTYSEKESNTIQDNLKFDVTLVEFETSITSKKFKEDKKPTKSVSNCRHCLGFYRWEGKNTALAKCSKMPNDTYIICVNNQSCPLGYEPYCKPTNYQWNSGHPFVGTEVLLKTLDSIDQDKTIYIVCKYEGDSTYLDLRTAKYFLDNTGEWALLPKE